MKPHEILAARFPEKSPTSLDMEELFEGITDISRYMGGEYKDTANDLRVFIERRLSEQWIEHEKTHGMYQWGFRHPKNELPQDMDSLRKEIHEKRKQYSHFFNSPESKIIADAMHGLCFLYSRKYVNLNARKFPQLTQEEINSFEYEVFQNTMRTFKENNNTRFSSYYIHGLERIGQRITKYIYGTTHTNFKKIRFMDGLKSLDETIGQTGEDTRYAVTEDPDAPMPDQEAAKNEQNNLNRGRITALLKFLPTREAKIITWRFGLDGQGTHTLEEIGDKLGISKARVGQLEERALRRLQQLPERITTQKTGAIANEEAPIIASEKIPVTEKVSVRTEDSSTKLSSEPITLPDYMMDEIYDPYAADKPHPLGSKLQLLRETRGISRLNLAEKVIQMIEAIPVANKDDVQKFYKAKSKYIVEAEEGKILPSSTIITAIAKAFEALGVGLSPEEHAAIYKLRQTSSQSQNRQKEGGTNIGI